MNIRVDAKYITLNFRGMGDVFKKLQHIKVNAQQGTKEESGQPPSTPDPFDQLWNNEGAVSGEILEKALRNNGYLLCGVYLENLNNQQQQLKIVFKNVGAAEGTPEEEMLKSEHEQLSADILAEARVVLKQAVKFSHARLYKSESPRVPNVQIMMLQPVRTDLRQITVRNGVIMTVLAKDLNEDERLKDTTHRFASRLVGR